MVSLIQATEKSLSLLRSSPERVTANLASGTFSSFVIIQTPEYAPEKGGGACALHFGSDKHRGRTTGSRVYPR
jgi:hypothetical protein